MATILFVHGTGVREESYTQSLGLIRGALDQDRWTIAPCFWGKRFGADLDRDCASIPKFAETLDTEMPLTELDRRIALWGALYQDPMYQLRLYEIRNQREEDAGEQALKNLGRLNLFESLGPKVRKAATDGVILDQVRRCRLERVWGEAIDKALKSTEFRALRFAYENTTEVRQAIARAVIAQALLCKYPDLEWLSISARERDRLEELMLEALGGRDQSEGESFLKQIIAGFITSKVRKRRGQLSLDHFAVAGDILLYQARGHAICSFIAARVEELHRETQSPVVLLAHSLGGIACVDLLIREDLREKVGMLVTVGSQAPFLYEMNALVSREFSEPLPHRLPGHFPSRWLNVYDPRDFLSYLASGVFSGPVIEDVPVDNGHPFPQAHNTYWENPDLWQAITERYDER